MMMNILFFVLFIILSAFIGVTVAHDPGMLLIAYHQTSIEMPLWLGAVLVFTMVPLLYLAIGVINAIVSAPTDLKAWLKQRSLRKERRRTHEGFIALAEGQWAKAEKLFIVGYHHDHINAINYLCAATAANHLGHFDRRDEYLKQAYASDNRAELAIEITAARLQRDAGQKDLSLATLTRLQSIAPKNKYIAKLLQSL